jgi:hypothetical protein
MSEFTLSLLVLVPFAIFNLILLVVVINLTRKRFVEIYKTKGIKPLILTALYMCFIVFLVIMFDNFIVK